MNLKRKLNTNVEDFNDVNIIKRSKMYKELYDGINEDDDKLNISNVFPMYNNLNNIESIDDIFKILRFILYWDIDQKDLYDIQNIIYTYLFNHRNEFLINYQKIIDNISIEVPYRWIFLLSIGINPNDTTEIPTTIPSIETIMTESVKYNLCNSLSIYLIEFMNVDLKIVHMNNALKFSNKIMITYLKSINCPCNTESFYHLFNFCIKMNLSISKILNHIKITLEFQNIVASFGSLEILKILNDNNLLSNKNCIREAAKNGHMEVVRYLLSIFDYTISNVNYIDFYEIAILNGHYFIFNELNNENKISDEHGNIIVSNLLSYNNSNIFNCKTSENFNIIKYHCDLKIFLDDLRKTKLSFFNKIDILHIKYIIKNNNEDLVKLLFEIIISNKLKIKRNSIIEYIIEYGTLSMLKDFHIILKSKLKYDDLRLTLLATKFNKLDMLIYLTENGSHKDPDVINLAISNCNKPIFDYAVKNNYFFFKENLILELTNKIIMFNHVLTTISE